MDIDLKKVFKVQAFRRDYAVKRKQTKGLTNMFASRMISCRRIIWMGNTEETFNKATFIQSKKINK